MRSRREETLNLALVSIVAIVLLLTLIPSRGGTVDARAICVLCGSRGLADSILNVLLFIPLGLALGARIRSNGPALAFAILLSVGVEAAQILIPGRDSSISDVLFNSLGAVLGVGLARHWRAWLTPGPRASRYLAGSATVLALLVLIGTDLLLRPAFPSMQYDATWTPRLRARPYYEGTVLEASVGETPTPPGFLEDSDRVRAQLLAGEPLRARVVTAAPPDGVAPVVGINGFQLEIVSLNLGAADFVFRRRTRALAFLLDQPELVFEGALAGVRPGLIVNLAAERVGDSFCLSVDDLRQCGLGFTLGDGWSILLWSAGITSRLGLLFDLAWLALLTLPIAFWGPTSRSLALGCAALLLGLGLIPALGPLLPTPWTHYAAVVAGFAAGRGIRSSIGRVTG